MQCNFFGLNTRCTTSPRLHYDPTWDHFETICKVYKGDTDESTGFQFVKGHADFSVSHMPWNLSNRMKAIANFVSLGINSCNLWSSLKCLETQSFVGQPLVDALDCITKGSVRPLRIFGNMARVEIFSTTSVLNEPGSSPPSTCRFRVSFGMMPSCFASYLVLSTTSATSPFPRCDRILDLVAFDQQQLST